MPQIVDYLSYARPARSYDEIELTRLQLVYEQACHVIGVNVGDPRRETIALLVFQAADLGNQPDEILDRVLTLYRRPS